jgi:hypothetical protein
VMIVLGGFLARALTRPLRTTRKAP